MSEIDIALNPGSFLRSFNDGVYAEDPKATVRETMQWLDRINVDQRPARLDLFLRQCGDARVRQAVADLVGSLCCQGKSCNYSELSHGLAAARSRWRQRRLQEKHANTVLPELNGPPTFLNGVSWKTPYCTKVHIVPRYNRHSSFPPVYHAQLKNVDNSNGLMNESSQ